MDNIKKMLENPIARNAIMGLGIFMIIAVSYTHLTLPTSADV